MVVLSFRDIYTGWKKEPIWPSWFSCSYCTWRRKPLCSRTGCRPSSWKAAWQNRTERAWWTPSWSMAAKANSLLGYIRKGADRRLKKESALVRPLLKYCSFLEHCSRLHSTRKTETCWSNSTKSITKMMKGLDHLSSGERQSELKLFSLENRRFINLCKYMTLGKNSLWLVASRGRKGRNMYILEMWEISLK